MTKIEIDLTDVVDYDSLSDSIIENLSEDIHNSNPDWWAEKVCKPMQEDLKKLLEDRELKQNSIAQLLEDYVGVDYIRDRIDRDIGEQVRAVIREKMKDFDVTITRKVDRLSLEELREYYDD